MGRAHTAAPVTTCRPTAGTRWTCAGRSATCRGPRRHTPAPWKRTEGRNHVNVSCSTKYYAVTKMCNPSGGTSMPPHFR
jgi:hypothetical protein